jgi:hypothetical protein
LAFRPVSDLGKEHFPASDMSKIQDALLMNSTERLDEVARLMALGFLRLRARRQREKANDPNHLREFGLDFGAEGSVCDTDTHADRERA